MTGQLGKAFEDRFGMPSDRPLSAHDETPLVRMASRRSVRQFSERPIDDGLLNAILLATQSAPAKSDLQQYSIIIIREASRRAQLAEIAGGTPWIATAPVVLVFLGDLRRLRTICTAHGRSYQNDNLDSFMNAAVDAGIALATCIQASESQGLGTCPLSIIRNRIADTAQFLDLPDQVFPLAALGLGYPAEQPAISLRLPPDVIQHQETYNDEAALTAIAAYDQRRAQTSPIADEKQRHIDRFGVEPGMTWSKNAARQMAVPERAQFKQWLESHGLTTD